MAVTTPRPELDAIRAVIERGFPSLAGQDIEFLSEGWVSRVYRAGDYVVRLAKLPGTEESIATERALLPLLAPRLPVPIPNPELYCADGYEGLPMVAYRMLPGEPLSSLLPVNGARLGRPLGLFLKALHSTPIEILEGIDLPRYDGAAWQERLEERFQRIRERVLGLVSEAARREVEERHRRYVADDAHFSFRPSLVHFDLGEPNLLVDPRTLGLTGVIDWSDVRVGDPAIDFECILQASGQSRLRDTLGGPGCMAAVQAYGATPGYVERTRYYAYLAPYNSAHSGLRLGYDNEAARALQEIERQVGRMP